jgi:hypothetical protein
MAIDAIIAAIADTAAADVGAAVVGDAVAGAVADTAITDAVATAAGDALAAGATDAGVAAATDAAATGAADAVASGATATDAAAAGVDAASGAVAPATETTTAATGAGGAGPVATDASGATTQVFDDGSTLTTHADGTVSATDTAGKATSTLISPGGPGQAPVYDATPTAVPGAGAGTPDPTLMQGLKDYAGAVADTLGTPGLLGAGALGGAALTGALTPNSNLTGNVGSGDVKYEWGQGIPLVSPGLNPGYISQAASQPYYHTGSPTDAQYYWGVHAPVNTMADLANYNQQPGAPATPWGAGHGQVGATPGFNPVDFVNQYILNPQWSGVMNATSPGYTGPAVPQQP